MKYVTPKEASKAWGISQRRVHALLNQGRVRGAERHGWTWLIPLNTPKPQDARIKSGRYVRSQREAAAGDGLILPRERLVQRLCPSGSRLTFIQAGAGYGKTTLMLQYAKGRKDVVWMPLDARDNDTLFFLRHLERAIREKLRTFKFDAADFIPLAAGGDFAPLTASALTKAIGSNRLTVMMDDVHVVRNDAIADLMTLWAGMCPPGTSLVMASRSAPWMGLMRLKIEGGIAEFGQEDLCFSREEAQALWGFFDEDTYSATEGWGLAIQSCLLAFKGKGIVSVSREQAEQDLYRYLLGEILTQMPATTQRFLKATSGLPILEADLCDALLGINDSRRTLERLVSQNIFTQRISSGAYRYHSLFRAFLRQNDDGLGEETLRRAMEYFSAKGQYEQAADCALILKDERAVQAAVGETLGNPFSWSRGQSLKKCLDFLEAQNALLTPRSMLAKGMMLSDQGEFYQAEKYLSAAIPDVGRDRSLYLHAMAHMARVLRNRVSFEESNRCLTVLEPLLKDAPAEDLYVVMIEKIHNLILTSRLFEAKALIDRLIDRCLSLGAPGVKAWFERYLSVIFFYIGDCINCIRCYERSLAIPKAEQDWLMRHSVGTYAAKAYQIIGQEEKIEPLLKAELASLKRLGYYEEYSLHYLLQAEIAHTGEFLKFCQKQPYDFSATETFLGLAEEYAVLNRSTRDHALSVKIWRLCTGLSTHPEKAEQSIAETLTIIERTTPCFQTLAYGRMANALAMLGWAPERSKEFFLKSIRIGEEIGSYIYAVHAYGNLSGIFLREGKLEEAREYARRFLECAKRYGVHYYMRFTQLFEPALKLAAESGILPEFTREMLSYGGYAMCRVYVHTLGEFYVAPIHDRESHVKIRTQKARELLAYLLEHPKGVGRRQIQEDLWGESEADATSVFHTRRGEIRRAFESLGAKNPVLYEKGLYRLDREEIACDLDGFRQAVEEFQHQPTAQTACGVVDRYTGRYLDDLEALWAESARLHHEDRFWEAAETLLAEYRRQGERSKVAGLLRRLGEQAGSTAEARR